MALGQDTEAEVPSKQGTVHIAISKQLEQLSILEDMIGRLETRLGPVMGPSSPDKVDTRAEDALKTDSIAGKIEHHTADIRGITRRVKEMTGRLEV